MTDQPLRRGGTAPRDGGEWETCVCKYIWKLKILYYLNFKRRLDL